MKRWLLSMTAVMGILCVCGSSYGQGPGGPGGPGGRGGRGGFGGPPGGGGGMEVLMDENVRKELDIVDDQVTKIRAVGDKMREEMREMFSGMRDLSDEDRQAKFAELREKMQARTQSMQKEIDEILLPQQRDRLKQVMLQSRIRNQGTSNALASDEIAKELDITDEQKQKLREAAEQAQTEMRQKMEKLRDEAEQKVLSVLTPAQQDKLKKLIGSKIEFSQPQFGRGPGGPGGPGGAGGGRPGGAPLQRPASGD